MKAILTAMAMFVGSMAFAQDKSKFRPRTAEETPLPPPIEERVDRLEADVAALKYTQDAIIQRLDRLISGAAGASVPVAVKVNPVRVSVASSGSSWTWPGGTENSLRQHLASTHGYSSAALAGMSFDELKAMHNNAHSGVSAASVRTYAAPTAVSAVSSYSSYIASSCPGGVCPASGAASRGFGLLRRSR